MKKQLLAICLFAFFVTPLAPALAMTDERLLPITRSVVTERIAHLPISSAAQIKILLRAENSHVLDTAYEQYTLLWNKNPKNPYTNLLRGLSAELFFSDSMDLRLQPLYGLQSSRTDLFPVAASCLKTAAVTSPKSAEAKAEYGYWLWQFGDETEQGLSLVKDAVKLAPSNSRIYATLGLIYSNQSSNAYSLNQATAELQHAVQLDPSYAYPHALLARIYKWQHRDFQSDQERLIFKSLSPKNVL